MTSTNEHPENPQEDPALEESFGEVRKALAGLKYGSVSITVHEGRVVQIDVTEKKRFKPN